MPKTDAQPPTSGFQSLFRNYAFLTLWIGQIVSQVADKIFFVLLIALVVNYQPPRFLENSMRSSVMIANTLPAVFLGSAAGLFVDRWSKKQILWVTNLMRGSLVLLIPILAQTHFLLLLLIAAMESILTQFFAPAEQAAIPVLVEEQNLMAANALFTTTMMGSLVVGFAIGDPVLGAAHRFGGLFGREILVGGLYVLAALILALVPMREKKHPASVRLHPWQDLKQGLQYLRKNQRISSAMIQLTSLYCVFAALSVLAIGLAAEIGLKETQFGFLLASAGVGLIIGAAFLGQWGGRFNHLPLPLVGFCSMGIMLIGFSLIHQLWAGIALSVLLGIGAAFIGVPMQTLIQVETPSEMRGKVFGFQNNVVNIALSLPLAIAGLLADAVGLRVVLTGLGVLLWGVGLWTWHQTPKVQSISRP
ncbi:MFS transporter [Lyngbya confervoides]|uniref:MFS transporter n=1 Tax=Lyngbya confervoides BDU141951 TaxID=1574623 RepID=A0ABD4T7F2_9CYAN|nr:MFS transporter [Lyngbya confervoides]MCM1984669.1 MFS transporter [Lyngbya confervoides BDU141951]